MVGRIGNRDDPDQTTFELQKQSESDLGLHYLSRPFDSQLVFIIFEH